MISIGMYDWSGRLARLDITRVQSVQPRDETVAIMVDHIGFPIERIIGYGQDVRRTWT